jgi:hypothetical protein
MVLQGKTESWDVETNKKARRIGGLVMGNGSGTQRA